MQQKIPRWLGDRAGLIGLGLIVYSLGGALWGLVRPTFSAEVVSAERLIPDYSDSSHFIAFASFVIAAIVLSVALAIFAYLMQGSRKFVDLLWVGVVALAGAVSFLAVGDVVGMSVHGIGSADQLAPGTTITTVAAAKPGISGYLVAPFVAMLVYWSLQVLSPAAETTGPTDDNGQKAQQIQMTHKVENTHKTPSQH
ncbi:hypothetical protein D8M20_01725 [Corynebacterium propinquum]|uniref:hypothetical protein n=1 Tax=Corynebacterium propinquum TaxID=43769 RepID=UPI000F8650D2|nr:hypothetical protein [Corynebacterium propinquum]RUP80248.1 hypothetical protein D8M24_00935 [Corynebacterium propinquum]RUP90476.1 hypothetical protein D8M40_00935 [Corynebacterium propinquum]RUP97144.1 hypothetical protein D8M20_01725 [Corynebacterium propinquum]